MSEPIRDTVLEVIEASLEAQLLAVRRLRRRTSVPTAPKRRKGRSQVDLVEDVLREAGRPMHLREILSKVEERFGFRPDPDSLGSALTKRVVKKERFSRPDRNTFALLEELDAG